MNWKQFPIPFLRRAADGSAETYYKTDAELDAIAAGVPTDRLQLGAAAKQLLADPVLTLAFDRLKDDLVKAFTTSEAHKQDDRERAYFMIWALEGVRGKLRAMVSDAQIIEAEEKRRSSA